MADPTVRLRRIRRLATLLDTAIGIPGTRYRFGLDSLLGLVPAVGDGLAGLLSAYVIIEAARLGVSKKTLVRMLLNVAMDTGIGSIPVAGDVFDFLYKANQRNVRLLEAEIRRRSSTTRD